MIQNSKLARALAVRDAALSVVKRTGTWEVGFARHGDIKHLSARTGNFHISYRTPFQPLPKVDDMLTRRAAERGLTVPGNLPYGLDVWAPRKVLNIEWDDQGNVVLVSLRAGAWEAELIALAKSNAVA